MLNKSIQNKLFAGYFTVLLLMSIMAFYGMKLSEDALKASIGKSSVYSAEKMLGEMVYRVHNFIDDVELFAIDELFQEALYQSNKEFNQSNNIDTYINQKTSEWFSKDPTGLNPFVKRTVANALSKKMRDNFVNYLAQKKGYDLFPVFFLTNKYGANVALINPISDFYHGDKIWWKMAKEDGFYIGHAYYDDTIDVYSLPIAVRILDEKDMFAGVVQFSVVMPAIVRETEIFSKTYRTTEISLICGERKKLIYATKIYQFLDDVSQKAYLNPINADKGFFISTEGGIEKLFSYVKTDNVDNRYIPNWQIVIGHNTSEVLKQSIELKEKFLIGILILILVGIVLAIFVSRSITKPLARLLEGIKVIRGGDLTYRMEIQTSDEIKELAVAFNQMTASRQTVEDDLKYAHERLEHRVAQRTSELNLMNKNLNSEIRERKKAEKAYRTIFAQSPMGIGLLNSKTGAFLQINQKYCDITGYSKEEMIELDFQKLTHPEDLQEDLNQMTRLRKNEISSYFMEKRYICKDGKFKWVFLSVVPLWGDDTELLSHLAIVDDITDRKQVEEDKKKFESQLWQSQKMESIGTLAGGVAHEINNPINGIMNYAQLIKDRTVANPSIVEFASEIIYETERVANIVRNLLTFARQEKEAHSPARMKDIVDSSMALIQTICKKDQIVIDVDVPETLPKIKCRSQQIQQVIMNLITNARDALNEKYTDYSENKKILITSSLFKKDGRRWIRTSIQDFGIGITSEKIETIFDPFFTTKSRHVGTGLGLSISYGIVKDHHGELSVESDYGHRTNFRMDLPVDNGWDIEK